MADVVVRNGGSEEEFEREIEEKLGGLMGRFSSLSSSL